MSLDLTIPGKPSDIRAAAHWLDPGLAGPLDDASVELAAMVTDAQYYWTDESGYAFTDATQAVRRGNFAVPEYAKDAAEAMRAYAGRLERGREEFDGYADYAKRHGLTVCGEVIWFPATSLRICPDPNGPDSPELREWKKYQAKVDVYNELSSKVGTWWGELDVWIGEHLVKLVGNIDTLKVANSVYEGLVSNNEKVVEIALDYAGARVKRNLKDFRLRGSDLEGDAKTFRAGLKSGNPALRAAAEAADPRGLGKSARALSEMVEGVSKESRIIPVAGTVIAIVASGAEIANGESETSVFAGLAGGLGGGALVAAGVGAAIPPVWVALAVGFVAIAADAGAKWAWEAWVPLDSREAMDAGIDGFWDWAKPTSWFVDTP